LGMPVRVTVGNAWVKDGLIEVRSRQTREERRVGRVQVVAAIREVGAG
ncbi:MAG: hypothetical protein HY728_08975, partial [Candidatus Rokubacteria bacterium]|nr:hypothetical protein [Candidatus Rokubacteria bacterium]